MDTGGEIQTPTLTVNTLSRLEIWWCGQPVTRLKLRKQQALLVYLAMNSGQHDRSRLAGLLWGGQPEERARHNLRQALWSLRRRLGPEALESERLSAGLSALLSCRVDALDFEAEIERAAHCRRGGELVAAIGHLEAAIALYRGDFLARFDLPDCLEFEEWAMRRRAWLREYALEALTHLVAHQTQRGKYDRALGYAQQQLALDPWREEAHRALMRLLALTGQRSAALAQYEKCRRLLAEELGLEPLEETTTLYRQLVDWEIETPSGRVDWKTGLPFMGRGDEHAQLMAWWERARQGEGRLALVEGEAGVGKTRLVEEAIRYAETQNALVLHGRCYEFGGGVPYQPIAEALRGILREEEIRGPHLSSLSPVWLVELSRLLPELRQTSVDPPESVRISSGAARQRLFEAVVRFLRVSMANGQSELMDRSANPLFFFLDDLHWADQSTLDLLHYLVRQLSDAPVWIVGAYRPEEMSLSHPLTRLRQGLSRDRLVDHLILEPLSAGAVEEIARSLVGEEGEAAFGDFLYRESEGNPFILAETVSDLQERGVLRDKDDGRWQWGDPPAVEALPTVVQDVILQRVGRLSQAAQRLLTLAAVVGRQFDALLLHAVAGRDADAVDDSLNEWLTRRLVRRLPISSLQYDFGHDKIRATVYHTTEAGQRRVLHRRTGEALERLYLESIEEQIGLLAYHWEQADDAEKATDYLVRAGDQARLAYAHAEAVDYYQRALELLKEQASYNLAARTLMKLGLTYHDTLDFRRSRQAYEDGFTLWQRAGEMQERILSPAPHPLRTHWSEPLTLDPTRAGDAASGGFTRQLFSGLVESSSEMEVIPGVARAWEMSEGGRKYIFRLRDDVRWSDGPPVTAEDFEYAWKRVFAPRPAAGSPNASLLHTVKGARSFHRGEVEWGDVGVKALDEVTLAVELEMPTGYFLQLLTHPTTYPVPRHVVEAHGEDWTETGRIVTNGPFRLESWQRGKSIILSRNPGYYGRFTGNVQQVHVSLISNPAILMEMYETGDLDVALFWMSRPEMDHARQWHAGEFVSGPWLQTTFVGFDTSKPPFDDPRVRRAFALAIDRETLANVISGGYRFPATGGFVPSGMPGHSTEIGLPYDPEQAKRFMAEAGYLQASGRRFPLVNFLSSTTFDSQGEYLRAQWRELLGVESTREVIEASRYYHALDRMQPRIHLDGWLADYPDPDNFLRVGADIFRDLTHWQNKAYDRLVETARHIMDIEERMKLYQEADRILIEEAAIIPLEYGRWHGLIKPWVSKYLTSGIHTNFWKDVIIEPH